MNSPTVILSPENLCKIHAYSNSLSKDSSEKDLVEELRIK